MPSWWTWTWLWLLLLPTALVKALCASSQAAVAKLQAHQQAAKARRANVEKGLLKEGIELEEKKFKNILFVLVKSISYSFDIDLSFFRHDTIPGIFIEFLGEK